MHVALHDDDDDGEMDYNAASVVVLLSAAALHPTRLVVTYLCVIYDKDVTKGRLYSLLQPATANRN